MRGVGLDPNLKASATCFNSGGAAIKPSKGVMTMRIKTILSAAVLSTALTLAQTVRAVLPESLKGLDAIQAMELANNWGKGTGVQSFVTTDAVNFSFSSGQQLKVALPRDRMVVAIAPYVNQTHPCKTHYMSSCQGELRETAVKVLAKTPDGKTLYQGTVRTMKNGFLELWLPRNLTLQVSLEAGGGSASGLITTYNSSDTCITTFQLR